MRKLFTAFLLLCTSAVAEPIKLTTQNTVLLLGPVHPFSATVLESDIQESIQDKEGFHKDVYMVIHSPGGMVDPVLALAKVLPDMHTLHSVTILSMSAAAAISQLVGGQRYIVPKGRFLFHKVRQYVDGAVTAADAHQMFDEISKVDLQFNKICSRRMSLSLDEYSKQASKDWLFGSIMALKIKAADAVQDFECSSEVREWNMEVPTFDYISGAVIYKNFCDLLN